MKVRKRDNNVYHIKLEHQDDLYHLNLLLDEGDMVRALTERREATQSDRIRKERGKKQKMRLTVDVKNVEYQSFGQRLRCHGVIAVGERDQGSHHTLILEAGDDFDIGKSSWLPHQKKRLKEAAQPTVTALAPLKITFTKRVEPLTEPEPNCPNLLEPVAHTLPSTFTIML